MNIGIARFFEERSHYLRSFDDVATTSRLTEIHDVAQVVLVTEPEVRVAHVQAPRRFSSARTSSDPAPLVSKFT
jgi:hypothetical protein